MDADAQLASSFSFLFKPQPMRYATHIQSSASLETPSHTSSEVSLLSDPEFCPFDSEDEAPHRPSSATCNIYVLNLSCPRLAQEALEMDLERGV